MIFVSFQDFSPCVLFLVTCHLFCLQWMFLKSTSVKTTRKLGVNHKEEQVDKDNIILAHELVLFSVILGMR